MKTSVTLGHRGERPGPQGRHRAAERIGAELGLHIIVLIGKRVAGKGIERDWLGKMPLGTSC
jgi:hypothetical protein